MSLPPDDDRTLMSFKRTTEPSAPAAVAGSNNALPNGTRLAEFELTGVLGEGGFGIVYLAYDHTLERQVSLKEYMPAAFAARSTDACVSVQSGQNADSFQAGLRSFVNEARLLAQFDHPSLVKVYRFWEANGTAYMVMPYYVGPTLKKSLLARTRPPGEAWLQALLAALLDALELIHRQQCFHRDISPDNILMLEDGRPVLLDFGAARRAVAGVNQAFTVILKQGYAPIEQYAEMPGMRQGPWTDLYALASVVHFAIDGQPPPPAVARMMSDPYVPLASRHAGRFSAAFLEAIDRALAFNTEDRPQSVAEMRALLHPDLAVPEPVAAPPSMAAPVAAREEVAAGSQRRYLAITGMAVAVVALAGIERDPAPVAAPVPSRAQPAATVTVAKPPAVIAAAGRGKDSAPPGTATAPQAAPQPPDVTASPSEPAQAFDPVLALDDVLNGASPERYVRAQIIKPRVRINHDSFSFSLRTQNPGYVYVLMVGSDRSQFRLLFPNAVDQNNHITWREEIELPRPGWPMPAKGPAGANRFVVMVSDTRRDFRGAGLESGNPFSVFPIARAGQLQRAHAGTTPLFAGVPTCAPNGEQCSPKYAADAFSIEQFTP